jgi:hypothetical protein
MVKAEAQLAAEIAQLRALGLTRSDRHPR